MTEPSQQQHEPEEEQKAKRRQTKLTFFFVGSTQLVSIVLFVSPFFGSGFAWHQHLGPFTNWVDRRSIWPEDWVVIGIAAAALLLLCFRSDKIFTGVFACFAAFVWYAWGWLQMAMSA